MTAILIVEVHMSQNIKEKKNNKKVQEDELERATAAEEKEEGKRDYIVCLGWTEHAVLHGLCCVCDTCVLCVRVYAFACMYV